MDAAITALEQLRASFQEALNYTYEPESHYRRYEAKVEAMDEAINNLKYLQAQAASELATPED